MNSIAAGGVFCTFGPVWKQS